MSKDFSFGDTLDNLIANAGTEQRESSNPDFVRAEEKWTEGCPACGGSGSWRGRGICFKCKGQGSQTFRTSPEARAKARERSAIKRATKEAEKAAWREQFKTELQWLISAAQKQRDRAARGLKAWNFPEKMAAAVVEWGTLTDGQLKAVQKCMARDAEREAEREAERVKVAPTVDVTALEEAFAKAWTRAQRPGATAIDLKPLKLQSGKIDLAFRLGSVGTQWEGMIFVRRGERKLGHIKGGRFFCKHDCTDEEAAAVLDCAGEPAKAAVAFGKAWSCCGVCGRRLDNDESIARGIGPICAETFGF